MPIGEMFDLDELAEKCKERGRWTFFLSSVPLKVRKSAPLHVNRWDVAVTDRFIRFLGALQVQRMRLQFYRLNKLQVIADSGNDLCEETANLYIGMTHSVKRLVRSYVFHAKLGKKLLASLGF